MMMHKIKLFLTNSFAEATYDNVSVVVVNRPPLQYQIKSEPEYTFNPIIISAITAAITILFSILLLLWRQLSSKSPQLVCWRNLLMTTLNNLLITQGNIFLAPGSYFHSEFNGVGYNDFPRCCNVSTTNS